MAQQPVRITLQQAISEVFACINEFTQWGDELSLDRAIRSLDHLNRLMRATCYPMRNDGWRFTAIRPVAEPFRWNGREFPSAHEMIYGAATAFLDHLWFEIDREGYRKSRNYGEDTSPAEWTTILTGAGLDPQKLGDHWERAKSIILHLVPWRYPEDYSAISNAVTWENAKVRESFAVTSEPTDEPYWITLAEASVLAQRDKTTISRAAITDNGKHGKGRRFDAASVAKWVLSSESRKADRG